MYIFIMKKNLEYEKALVSLVDSILNLKGEKQRFYKKNYCCCVVFR